MATHSNKNKKTVLSFTKTGKVQGKVEDLINLDQKTINSLSRKELAGVVSKIADVYNKRLPRLEKEGSRASTNVLEGGGRFRAKGKNINELRKEFAREKAFGDDLSSTVSGTIQIRNDFIARLYKDTGEMSYRKKNKETGKFDKMMVEDIDADQFKELWKIYNQVQKEREVVFSEMRNITDFDSNQIQRLLTIRMIQGRSISSIKRELNKKIDKAMKKKGIEVKKINESIWSV